MSEVPHLRLVGRSPAQDTGGVDRTAGMDADVDADEIGYRSLALVEHGDGGADADDLVDEPDAPAEPAPNALSVRFVVIASIAFQFMSALSYSGKYATLARGGDEYLVATLLSAPASLCLYAGALLLALRPGRGRVLFIIAAVGFGLSLPAWGLSASWSWPMAFGAMLGLAGAWYARAEVTPDEASAAQP